MAETCRNLFTFKPYFLFVGTNLDNKNAVFWDVTPPDSCENLRFGGT
jgi:hypothetical protein